MLTGCAGRLRSRVVLWLLPLVLAACTTTVQLPPPRSLSIPEPREDNQGRYLFPYTQDYVLADWCDLLLKGKAFTAIGQGAGSTTAAAIGGSAMGVFSWALNRVAKSAGRNAAIRSIGGWEAVSSSSNISFDSIDDYAVYLYQFFSAEDTYPDALSAAILIYPELEDRYISAIQEAR